MPKSIYQTSSRLGSPIPKAFPSSICVIREPYGHVACGAVELMEPGQKGRWSASEDGACVGYGAGGVAH